MINKAGRMIMNFKSEVSKEELLSYPVEKFNGLITVVDSEEKLSESLYELKSSDIIGFDTETRPSFRKGRRNKIALMQLSTVKHAYLFRLNKIGLHPELLELLENKSITKVGVAINDDLKGLKEWNSFKPGGFIELQEMVKDYGIKSMGLKKLTAIILGFTISKKQQVTNWESQLLSDGQKTYAATDAWVCNLIYRKLKNGELIDNLL